MKLGKIQYVAVAGSGQQEFNMNEIETKVAEAIKDLVRLLIPMAVSFEEKHESEQALDTLRSNLIKAVGRRVIKGSN